MHAVPLAIGPVDVRGREHLGNRTRGNEVRVEQDALREAAAGDLGIMHRGQHRAPLLLPVAQDVRQLLGPEEVQAGERLVQQEDCLLYTSRCV